MRFPRRDRFPYPLVIPPVMLCAALIVALLFMACADETGQNGAGDLDDGDNGAPSAPGEGQVDRIPPVVPTLEDPCARAIRPDEALLAERQLVRGTITGARTVDDPLGGVTMLELGEQGGDDSDFAIAITQAALGNFDGEGEALGYEGQEVCAEGVVQEYFDTRVIFVQEPSQIVQAEAGSPGDGGSETDADANGPEGDSTPAE